MVRVYAARIPGMGHSHAEQSKWAYRLLDMAVTETYPEIGAPVFVEKDEYGKPFPKDYPELHISISHSGAFVACAVGEKPVGVDLEVWKNRRNREGVLRRFHLKEQSWFCGVPEEQKMEAFHDLWVVKESFVKAMGKGLRIPLDAFCVNVRAGKTVCVRQELSEEPYYCRLYPLQQEALSLAVCSEDKELAKQLIWLTLPQEFSETEESEQKE